MEEKKRQNGEDAPLDYEDLLNGFATEGGSPNASPPPTHGDLDGLALAELLGDDELRPEALHASGTFDAIAAEDYSSLARQFEELDLNVYTGDEQVQTESGPESVRDAEPESAVIGASPANISAEAEDYAAILNSLELDALPVSPVFSGPETDSAAFELDLDELAGEMPDFSALDLTRPDPADDTAISGAAAVSEPEFAATVGNAPDSGPDDAVPPSRRILDIVNLADTEIPAAMTGTEPEPETGTTDNVSASAPDEEPDTAAFSMHDLLSEVRESPTPATGAARIEPPAPKEAIPAASGAMDDILGFSAIAPAGERSRRKEITAEILFEGVEMDFDRQVDAVTLAELYLAQGRKREASDLYRQVSKEKGVTHWVAKRLRMLSAGSDK